MKKMFLLLSLTAAIAVQAQDEKPKLKDLLYSGKLKNTAGVVRKTDDLATKIDTSTKKQPEAEVVKTAAVQKADTQKIVAANVPPENNSVAVENTKTAVTQTNTEVGEKIVETPVVAAPVVAAAAPVKTNTKLWKEYSDSMTTVLKAEALSSKQIKKETYYLSFDYEIGTDGLVTVNTVSSTPTNNYLLAQVKQYLDNTPLRLNPVLDGNGQPRKVKRKQSYTITKD